MSTIQKIEKSANFRLVPGTKLPRAFTSNCLPDFTAPSNRINAFAGMLPSSCIAGEELAKGITHANPRVSPASIMPDAKKYATDGDTWTGGIGTGNDGYWLNGEATRPPWAAHGVTVSNPLTSNALAVSAAGGFINGYPGWAMKLMDFELLQGRQLLDQGKSNMRAIFQACKQVDPNVMLGCHHNQAYRVPINFFNPNTAGYDPNFWNSHYGKTKAQIENELGEDIFNGLFRTISGGSTRVSDFVEVSSINCYEIFLNASTIYSYIQIAELSKAKWGVNGSGKKINHLLTIEGFYETTAGSNQNDKMINSFKLPDGTAKTFGGGNGNWQNYSPSLYANVAAVAWFYADGILHFGGFYRDTELPQHYYDFTIDAVNTTYGAGPNFSFSQHQYRQHQDVVFDYLERISRYKTFIENTETIVRPEIYENGVWKTGDALLPASRHQAQSTHVGMRVVGTQALVLANDVFNDSSNEKIVKCRLTGWGEFDVIMRGSYPSLYILNQ